MAKILCKTCDHFEQCPQPKGCMVECDKYHNDKEQLDLENTEFNYGHNVNHKPLEDD